MNNTQIELEALKVTVDELSKRVSTLALELLQLHDTIASVYPKDYQLVDTTQSGGE